MAGEKVSSSVVILSDIMSSFFDKIVDQGKDILQDPSKISDYVEDPSKLLNVGLNFIGQDGECRDDIIENESEVAEDHCSLHSCTTLQCYRAGQ